MNNPFRVSEHLKSAGTRERGIRIFPILREAALSAPRDTRVIVSFEDVEFVSTSFLEETVLRLLTEDRDFADRLTVEGLQPFVSERLRAALIKMSQDPDIVSGDRVAKLA